MARAPADVVLAVEVGPHRTRASITDRRGTVRAAGEIPTPLGIGDVAAVEAIRELARTVATAPTSARVRLVGASVVVPGIVDAAAGIARYSAEFGWHNVPLANLVGTDVGVPVVVDHVVRACAVAEGERGAARGASDWLYVTIGPSIAGAAVVAGRLQRGATGSAGEFGHLPIYPFGEVCGCGQRGCVEAYATTTSMLERYERIARRPVDLAGLAARIGRDPLADEIWANAMAALGLGLTAYTMIEDPSLVVIGGELAAVAEVALPSLREELRARLLWRQPPRLVAAGLGSDAALTGAGALAWAGVDAP
jgi:glucokinase